MNSVPREKFNCSGYLCKIQAKELSKKIHFRRKYRTVGFLKEDGRKLRFPGIGGTSSRPIRGHRAKQPIHFISPAVFSCEWCADSVLSAPKPSFPRHEHRLRDSPSKEKVWKGGGWFQLEISVGRSETWFSHQGKSATDWIVFRGTITNFSFFGIKFDERFDRVHRTMFTFQRGELRN